LKADSQYINYLYLCTMMNQFPTLIEYLLLSHDYVVIPGLGTFIVQQQSAKRNVAEEAYLPPIRSVRFNTNLDHADDMLIEAIQVIFGKTVSEAEQTLCTWVNEFKQELEDTSIIDFGAIGTFTQDYNGDILFESHEAGVTTPEYYGLDAFHISEIAPAKQAKIVPMTASLENDGDAIVIRINRSIANTVVAACVAILLFVFFNNPIPEINTEQHSSVKELLMPSKSADKEDPAKVAIAEAKAISSTSKNTNTIQKPTSTKAKELATTEKFCVVMASHISHANAEHFVQQLSEEGFSNPRIIDNGKSIRVVVGHYGSEEDANISAREIRQRSREYNGSWVMKL